MYITNSKTYSRYDASSRLFSSWKIKVSKTWAIHLKHYHGVPVNCKKIALDIDKTFPFLLKYQNFNNILRYLNEI